MDSSLVHRVLLCLLPLLLVLRCMTALGDAHSSTFNRLDLPVRTLALFSLGASAAEGLGPGAVRATVLFSAVAPCRSLELVAGWDTSLDCPGPEQTLAVGVGCSPP